MKRILLLVLCLVFICSMLPTAGAADDICVCENAFSEMMELDGPNTKTEFTQKEPTTFYPSSVGFANHMSYSLLDVYQKRIYNAVKNAPIGTTTVTVQFSSGELLRSELTSGYLSEVMHAICYDLPQLFYHAGYSASYSYSKSTGYVSSLSYEILVNDAATYKGDLISAYNQLMSAVDSLEFDTSNRYNFVRSVHDYLCNQIIYPELDSSLYVKDCHDAYGALVTGYAVCQGYAEAFKLICDKYEIPCVYISGTANGGGHGWNGVQMDDGKWYLVDVTWDDQYRIFDDFFLVGLNTKDTYFGGSAFSQSHVADADLFLPPLNYATEKYTCDNHNTAFKATYNSIEDSESKILVRSIFDASESNIYYNGMYAQPDFIATGEVFSVPSGTDGAQQSWTLVLIGDCNGDGEADTSDYAQAVNKVLADTPVTSVYDKAADAHYDGYLDVIDLAILERAINGSNTNITLD